MIEAVSSLVFPKLEFVYILKNEVSNSCSAASLLNSKVYVGVLPIFLYEGDHSEPFVICTPEYAERLQDPIVDNIIQMRM